MKQVLHSAASGAVEIADVPCPSFGPSQVLVRTRRSLISAGTERMLLEFGRASLVGKARRQPERVRQVLDKIAADGLAPTLEAVRNRLERPLVPGYSNLGIVVDVGREVTGFRAGDRVACNGPHAEMVAVGANLCALVPDAVEDEAAAFTVIGAIALQGIRLAAPTLGEALAVTGLGLVGLLAVQLLRAQGCRVMGIDPDASRRELALRLGAETAVAPEAAAPTAKAFSRGRGVDAVLVCAATASSGPLRQAAQIARQRGRVVLVGVTGMQLERGTFYDKELSFQVSCSYGPGRYDPAYEIAGHDYPVGFVRWTEGRNLEAVLDMLAAGRIEVAPLISHRFPIAEAEAAYALVAGEEPSLGVLLDYPAAADGQARPSPSIRLGEPSVAAGSPGVGFIGAGAFASATLIPAFRAAGADLVSVASNGGVSGLAAARRFGFAEVTTDTDAVFADERISAVAIATRHDSHARLAAAALAAGKHVFVEKPLALTADELALIESARARAFADRNGRLLTVGYNRRFAPLIVRTKELLATAPGPKAMTMTVNAGALPRGHWAADPAEGGGRILGEACHFIDLLRHLADAPIAEYDIMRLAGAAADTASIRLGFVDGSVGTIHYFTNGNRRLPKERLEVFAAGRVLQFDNFRTLRGFGWPGFSRLSRARQDKGHRACARAFLAAIAAGGPAPIAFDELCEVARIAIELAEA